MTAIHFSYYELSLLSFLRESHPEKADDIPFIKERAAAASEAYTEAFDAGLPITECIGIANKTLYAGLHFSRHDTISSVLWNEFSAEVSLEAVRETAIRLRPLLEEVLPSIRFRTSSPICPNTTLSIRRLRVLSN